MYFQPGSGSGGTDFAVDGICGKFYNVEQNFAEVIPLYQIIDAHCHIYPDAIARKAAASTGVVITSTLRISLVNPRNS